MAGGILGVVCELTHLIITKIYDMDALCLPMYLKILRFPEIG